MLYKEEKGPWVFQDMGVGGQGGSMRDPRWHHGQPRWPVVVGGCELPLQHVGLCAGRHGGGT